MRRLILLIALAGLVMVLASSSASAVSDSNASPIYTDIGGNETTTNQTQEECPGGCHNWYYYDWHAW